ncbi:MAG: poly-beta-hydroxybutyrate polymerase N-terminal domain-containing protein [Rhodoferax sp.]
MNRSTSTALSQPGNTLDRWVHAQLSPLTRGISIASLRMAFDDWLTHLLHSPTQQLEIAEKVQHSMQQLTSYDARATLASGKPCLVPMVRDRRFSHQSWQTWPFDLISQSFLLTQQWWQDATIGVRGVSPHHEAVVSFTVRQLLDIASPANFVWTNPEVLERRLKSGGINLWRGVQNLIEDAQRFQAHKPPLGRLPSSGRRSARMA